MRFSTNNIGAFVAVISGVVSIGIGVWPGAPQYAYYESALWVVFSILIGVGFIAAAMIVDHHLQLARILLVGGAILKIGSAVIFGVLIGDEAAAALFDAAPALAALAAAAMIGPIEREAAP
jgi:hypothetical membrane protein